MSGFHRDQPLYTRHFHMNSSYAVRTMSNPSHNVLQDDIYSRRNPLYSYYSTTLHRAQGLGQLLSTSTWSNFPGATVHLPDRCSVRALISCCAALPWIEYDHTTIFQLRLHTSSCSNVVSITVQQCNPQIYQDAWTVGFQSPSASKVTSTTRTYRLLFTA